MLTCCCFLCCCCCCPFQKSSEVLSNQLQVSSVHASLWDGEAVFWTKSIARNLQRTRVKLRTLFKSRSRNSSKDSTASVVSVLFAFPVSVVTTVEASDWSIQVRVDSPLLPSKRPVMRGVMAACVGNVQWSPVENHTSSIRSIQLLHDSVPSLHRDC